MGIYNNITGHLNSEKLTNDYEPLIKTVYKRFHTYFESYDDKMDLFSQVYYEFSNLVQEYDPRRGVDFPCYIKRMLNQRVYHYITKKLKVINSENTVDDVTVYTQDEDFNAQDSFIRVECLENLDEEMILGKKQRDLMFGILAQGKSLEELAEEEGVNVKTLRLRLHFLSKKLIENNTEIEDYDRFQQIHRVAIRTKNEQLD